MKEKIQILFLFLLTTMSVLGQKKETLLGRCDSYSIDGNTVIFQCEKNQKVALKFLGEEVIRIWVSTNGEFKRQNPSFAVINEDLGWKGSVQVSESAEAYEMYTAALRIRITRAPFGIQVFDKYQKLLMGDYQDKGFVQADGNYTFRKSLRKDEHIIGLGEKSGPIDRKGRSYKMWNSDLPCYGVEEDPLYKSIPFFMSNKRYGIFFDNTYKTEFDFGVEQEDAYSFSAPNGALVYYFIYGPDYKDMLSKYIQLTGKPIMPPSWAFGFSQCRGLYTKESQAREVAAEFRKRQIPCDIIYQDIGWTNGLQDFEWRKGNYTDPKGMLKDLGAMGFKMIVSQDPVISKSTLPQFQEADSKGYFTKDIRTGKTYDMPWPWGGNCGVVDFTNPEVADWWGSYQQKPINDGVRGFWTDMGEPAWSNEDAPDRLFMKHQAGMHDEIHNVYGLTWDKVVTEQFYKHNPNQRVFQMTRAAYAGLQRYTFGWSGDSGNGDNVENSWAQMANQVPVGVSAGLGLIPFWTSDISGYCGDIKDHAAIAELYVRWMQYGIFNPLTRAHHEGDNAVEPWMFGAEAEAIVKKTIELKYQLFPYIYTLAREAYDTGVPLLRAMPVEFPADRESYRQNGQFMFGSQMLVAPVLEKDALSKDVYLPEGDWVNFFEPSQKYKGGQYITVDAPLHVIPVFVKRGSIIPRMPIMQYIGQEMNYPITYQVFPPAAGKLVAFELYEDQGEDRAYEQDIFDKKNLLVKTLTDGFDIQYKIVANKANVRPGIAVEIQIEQVDKEPKSVTISGQKIKKTGLKKWSVNNENSASWTYDSQTKQLKIQFTDAESVQVSIR